MGVESRPSRNSSQGAENWLRYDDQEFYVLWIERDTPGSSETIIRPVMKYHPDAFGDAPEWWPNNWPRFDSIIELRAVIQILETWKNLYAAAERKGRIDKTSEIRRALGI